VVNEARGSGLVDQQVREVGVRELAHHTAEVVRSIEDGERLVVTRHGNPVAVLLSVADAIEAIVVPGLEALAHRARRDLEAGRITHIGPPGPMPVVLAREAAAAHERMNAQDRMALRVALMGGPADESKLLWLRSRRWLVAFSYPEPEFVLVHGAFEARVVERELIGEEIWAARRRRRIGRWLHGRA
jgi:prevent-host-death family protein